jgi:hypothetical protein
MSYKSSAADMLEFRTCACAPFRKQCDIDNRQHRFKRRFVADNFRRRLFIFDRSGRHPYGATGFIRRQCRNHETGDISGTICDCGEIAVPGGGGGFPKLALLGLAAIPLAFIHGNKHAAF